MFNWFFSKAPSTNNATHDSATSANMAKKQSPLAVAENKAKTKPASYTVYIPGAKWLTNKAILFKNTVVNSLPSIGLTGRGLTINGFSFALDNIPGNLQKTLKFSLALLLVTTAKAQEFYFTDPSKRTHYQLKFIPEYYGDFTNTVDKIKLACNTTFSSTPFSLNFTDIETWSTTIPVTVWQASESALVDTVSITTAIFARAKTDMPSPSIESCVTEIMNGPPLPLPSIFAISAVAAVLLCGSIASCWVCTRRSENNNLPQVNQPQPPLPQLQPAHPQPPHVALPIQPLNPPPLPHNNGLVDDDSATETTRFFP